MTSLSESASSTSASSSASSTHQQNATTDILTVHSPKTDYSFPLTSEEIELLLYLHVAQLPHQIVRSLYPVSTVTGAFPTVQYGRIVVPAFDAIYYLQKDHCDLDEHLTSVQKADSLTYRSMIRESLAPCLTFLQFSVDKNYSKSTRLTIASDISIPICWMMQWAERKRMLDYVQIKRIQHIDEAIARANMCYSMLSNKLATNSYFFGYDKPSCLDVAVAAIVALHYNSPLPENPLKKVLESYPDLLAHYQAMVSRYGLSQWLPPTSTSSASASSSSLSSSASSSSSSSLTMTAAPKPRHKTPNQPALHHVEVQLEYNKRHPGVFTRLYRWWYNIPNPYPEEEAKEKAEQERLANSSTEKWRTRMLNIGIVASAAAVVVGIVLWSKSGSKVDTAAATQTHTETKVAPMPIKKA
eukprot:TRINITY_DN2828_c0_g1_i1.p1 TRINITY_DN2828_c0_g1~~TRINITY_DN2828_c0_g1_i1.p1  ORF type:complete len:430 (+),score=75.53 TRINITY_DN2828_c0_g1_i1:52-1290(+)